MSTFREGCRGTYVFVRLLLPASPFRLFTRESFALSDPFSKRTVSRENRTSSWRKDIFRYYENSRSSKGKIDATTVSGADRRTDSGNTSERILQTRIFLYRLLGTKCKIYVVLEIVEKEKKERCHRERMKIFHV